MIPTKNWIWIITLFVLDPLTAAYRPCENPLTDDVDDIPELIKNLPNDYKITLKYVNEMGYIHKHCWLHLMVLEFAKSLNNLLHKFPRTSSASKNHSILNSLTRMVDKLLEYLTLDQQKNFKKQSDYSYAENEFSPKEFFKQLNNMIETFKVFSKIPEYDNCVFSSTTEALCNASEVTETELPYPPPPVATRSLKNDYLKEIDVMLSSKPKNEGSELLQAKRETTQGLNQLITAEQRAQAILFGLMLILFFISIICLFFAYRSLSRQLKVLSTFVYVKLPPHLHVKFEDESEL
ncbi:PREDICTED: kit ligand-like [Gavialis gangeticus]|uniref:kit ligand-like n=1 Tax=Gavialis gangeticus TaxID=94835 RepID=UPI00092E85B8|nr:PREDICTED: kit ligand-like [Gavialis gangeticus]